MFSKTGPIIYSRLEDEQRGVFLDAFSELTKDYHTYAMLTWLGGVLGIHHLYLRAYGSFLLQSVANVSAIFFFASGVWHAKGDYLLFALIGASISVAMWMFSIVRLDRRVWEFYEEYEGTILKNLYKALMRQKSRARSPDPRGQD